MILISNFINFLSILNRSEVVRYHVLVGSLEYRKGHKHEVSHIILHPGFNQQTFENDVAVLKIKIPLRFAQNVRSIVLAREEVRHEKRATAYGFNNILGLFTTFKALNVSVLPLGRCRVFYGTSLASSKICTYCIGCNYCMVSYFLMIISTRRP